MDDNPPRLQRHDDPPTAALDSVLTPYGSRVKEILAKTAHGSHTKAILNEQGDDSGGLKGYDSKHHARWAERDIGQADQPGSAPPPEPPASFEGTDTASERPEKVRLLPALMDTADMQSRLLERLAHRPSRVSRKDPVILNDAYMAEKEQRRAAPVAEARRRAVAVAEARRRAVAAAEAQRRAVAAAEAQRRAAAERAAARGAPGERRSRRIPNDVLIKVSVRDQGKCVECGATGDLHFDHKIPWSKNGENTVSNIQLMCGECNRRKGAVDAEDW